MFIISGVNSITRNGGENGSGEMTSSWKNRLVMACAVGQQNGERITKSESKGPNRSLKKSAKIGMDSSQDDLEEQ